MVHDSQPQFVRYCQFFQGISVMKSFAIKRIMLGVSAVALMAGTIPLALAQGSTDAAAQEGATTTTPKPTKAERKAERKQARAKKNAELKKLEDAGYQPAQNDPNYPDKLQAAQKKAGVGVPASQ
ncbi:hypothetical protein OKW26_002508 [Paraburkholderia sp. 32]